MITILKNLKLFLRIITYLRQEGNGMKENLNRNVVYKIICFINVEMGYFYTLFPSYSCC